MRQPIPRQPPQPWQILLPVAALALSLGALGLIVWQLAGADPPPVVRIDEPPAATSEAGDPYSLRSLYRRLPPEGMERVAGYVDYFRKSRRRGLQDGLGRSTRYIARFRRIFARAGIPAELAYLPLIESGFMEHAVSPAKAVGVWQFTAETGRRYNLNANSWFDKRRDPIQSAWAAARYLGHLHRKFKNWDLALAAYNSGEGTVSWAIRVNRRAGLPTSYWDLELPEETENYVPAFIAAALIAKNPGAFGFKKIRFAPKMAYEWIKVSAGLPLGLLAQQFEVAEEELFALNPELIRGQVPPGDSNYRLRIPLGTRRVLPAKLKAAKKFPRDWLLHHVAATDTLQGLADRFSAHPEKIMRLNRLRDGSELTERAFLIIPL